jgi:hypothetical protein
MTDLKLIDELLCRLFWQKSQKLSLEEFVKSDSCIEKALDRLRKAYWRNEINDPGITLAFAKMFEKEGSRNAKTN